MLLSPPANRGALPCRRFVRSAPRGDSVFDGAGRRGACPAVARASARPRRSRVDRHGGIRPASRRLSAEVRVHFGKDGFRRLTDDGAWFTNCHYPYAVTKTAAGHASLATGTSPDRHGIISNDWYDRQNEITAYCVGSERYEQVPPRAGKPKEADKDKKKAAEGISPETLKAPTLADALKKATDGKARVVSLSFKDRSAVLLGGARPDACYWFDTATGGFVTSTYYRDRVHGWVDAFNRA